jgi:Flp pilus assembly protein TadB
MQPIPRNSNPPEGFAMNVAMVAQTIQFVLAPVVMVSAAAILLSGFLSRYASINDRMRQMARERLDLLRERGSGQHDPYLDERRSEIDAQLPELVHRHRLVRDSVLVLYLAIVAFVASMFVIALAAIAGFDVVAPGALILFLGGTALLLYGLVLTAAEVRSSHRAVEYEVRRILALKREPDDLDPTGNQAYPQE